MRYRNAATPSIVLLVICCLAAAALAQGVTGRVTDSRTGEPIADAKIIFNHTGQSHLVYGVKSDADGYFDTGEITERFEHKAGDIVIVTVTARGYGQIDSQVILERGVSQENFQLYSIQERIQRVFTLQHRKVEDLFDMLRPYVINMQDIGISEQFNTITVKESPEQLQRIAQVIDEFDTPLKQIWLEVILVLASGDGTRGAEFPPELADVVAKLGPLFVFDRYRIIGRANAMGLEGSTLVFSSGTDDAESADFQVLVEGLGYANGIVKLEDLRIDVRKPTSKHIKTTVNVTAGEMVILGASSGDAAEGSLITVVTARIGS